MEPNNIVEFNKLEDQIKETQLLLENNDKVVKKLETTKTWKNIFLALSIILLSGLLWSLFTKKAPLNDADFEKENLTLVNKDSLNLYKTQFLAGDRTMNNLNSEKVIYSVQIGAFQDFNLTSDGLMNLAEFKADGYNKFSMGNYKTYAEAKVLKDSLILLGFKDCFLAAKSFGNPINIREALTLSNEPEFLEQ